MGTHKGYINTSGDLPLQIGNAGKILSTDGTNTSWTLPTNSSTLQAALDAGSTLDKNNTINAGINNLYIVGVKDFRVSATNMDNSRTQIELSSENSNSPYGLIYTSNSDSSNRTELGFTPTSVYINKNNAGAKEIATVNYKVYTALLTQTGTAAPVATVLENTIGNIVWTRASVGVYLATLSGAFNPSKTILFIQNKGLSAETIHFDINNGSELSVVHVAIIDTGGGNIGESPREGLDLLGIEIRVYP